MVTSMVLLQLKAPGVIHSSRSVPVLEEILDILDNFNKLAPGLDRDDKEDLSWPGVWSKWEIDWLIDWFQLTEWLNDWLQYDDSLNIFYLIFYQRDRAQVLKVISPSP